MLQTAREETGHAGPSEWFGGWRWMPWLESVAHQYRRGVWAFIVCFYLLSINGLWRATPDSALYLSVARSIARGEGYVYHGEIHRLAYPGLPYFLAGLMKISPAYFLAIADLAMVLMSLAGFWLTYRMLLQLVRPGVAMIVTLVVAVNYQVYQCGLTILTDAPFFMGSLAVLYGGMLCGVLPARPLDKSIPPRHNPPGGFVLLVGGLALCAITRPVSYLLFGCTVLAAMFAAWQAPTLNRRRAALIAVGAIAGLVAIAAAIVALDPRRNQAASSDIYEQAMTWHIRQATSDLSKPLTSGWHLIGTELSEAMFATSMTRPGDVIVSSATLIAAGIILRRWPMALLWLSATLAIQLFVKPVPRYMIPVMPLLYLAWWQMAECFNRKSSQHVANVLTIAMFVMLAPNVGRDIGRVWYSQYCRPFERYYRDGKYEAVFEMGQILQDSTPANAMIIAPRETGRVLTWLADRRVVEPPFIEPITQPLFVVVTGNPDDAMAEHWADRVILRRKCLATEARYHKGASLELWEAALAEHQ